MNVLETIIAIFLAIVVVMTAISEPVLSWEYSKATVKSCVKVVKITKSLISSVINSVSEEVKNNGGNQTNAS